MLHFSSISRNDPYGAAQKLHSMVATLEIFLLFTYLFAGKVKSLTHCKKKKKIFCNMKNIIKNPLNLKTCVFRINQYNPQEEIHWENNIYWAF